MKHLPVYFVLLLCAPALAEERPDWYGAEYQECSGGNTLEIVECVKEHEQAWDRRLNEAYQTLMNELPNKRRSTLRDAQRLWIKYRDANCDFYFSREGSIRSIEAAECVRVMTAQRAMEFELLLKP